MGSKQRAGRVQFLDGSVYLSLVNDTKGFVLEDLEFGFRRFRTRVPDGVTVVEKKRWMTRDLY